MQAAMLCGRADRDGVWRGGFDHHDQLTGTQPHNTGARRRHDIELQNITVESRDTLDVVHANRDVVGTHAYAAYIASWMIFVIV